MTNPASDANCSGLGMAGELSSCQDQMSQHCWSAKCLSPSLSLSPPSRPIDGNPVGLQLASLGTKMNYIFKQNIGKSYLSKGNTISNTGTNSMLHFPKT